MKLYNKYSNYLRIMQENQQKNNEMDAKSYPR